MIWIKICGTTNLEDALTAVNAGADALGFVFYEKSPRKIDEESARKIVAELPSNIEKVGVFVNEPVERVLKTVAQVGLTAVQLHGVECQEPGFARRLKDNRNLKVFLVLSPTEIGIGVDLNGDGATSVDGAFFDSGTPQLPGGTGKTFDWKVAASRIKEIGERVKVVVAGGLNSANVGDAIRILKPWGVDVASGVEARPGKKDPEKVRAFIDAVRNEEKKN
jgi:phosphoribosylanthranilate isomerase